MANRFETNAQLAIEMIQKILDTRHIQTVNMIKQQQQQVVIKATRQCSQSPFAVAPT